MAVEETGSTSDDLHLADDSERRQNAAASTGCAYVACSSGLATRDDIHLPVRGRPSEDPPAPPVEEEHRFARDGSAYTFREFLDYYGEEVGTSNWNTARLLSRDGCPQTPVSENDPSPSSGVVQRSPRPYSFAYVRSSAAQPEPEAEEAPSPETNSSESAEEARDEESKLPWEAHFFRAYKTRHGSKCHVTPNCIGVQGKPCLEQQGLQPRGRHWCLLCARHLQ